MSRTAFWRTALPGMIGVLILLLAGTRLIDGAFRWAQAAGDPRYRTLPGTCYFAGDARNYMRIALDGYTRYTPGLETPHFTQLNDRSWWPLFPLLTSAVIRLGGGVCSGRAVNAIALVLLAPLVQAITGERRARRLWLLATLPYGAWLFIGGADALFLALSALLVLIIMHSARRPVGAGLGAFAAGLLVGLLKPNGLALLPALIVWGIGLARDHLRAESPVPPWRRALDNHNPGWAPILGGLGIALGTSWWFYQTSGYYPFYVLMIQRTLWWREFTGGSPSSFAYVFHTALGSAWRGPLDMDTLYRLSELANMVLALALGLGQLPPRWPGGERIAIPLHWRIGLLSPYLLMAASGQSHSIERYSVGNIFMLLVWWRLLFGAPGQRVTWRPWTLPGLLRVVLLLIGPLTWLLAFLQLGWEPLNHGWP